jgi:phosphoribosylformylglycinamidine cyclo-ligase
MENTRPITYRDAGVDIAAGNELVQRIKPAVRKTKRPGVLGSIGGFGGLFELDIGNYQAPVLVAATDGVGTKLDLALKADRLGGVGIDLVAMCANDLVVQGAEPLFFLDYFVSGRIEVEVAARVIEGIADGCLLAGAALLGGETAEHPGTFPVGEFDLAGFCVGVVEKDRIIDGSTIADGDKIIGLASSGPHSNGFSLIRRLIADGGHLLSEKLGATTLGDALLEPTRIYVKSSLALAREVPVRGFSHITGGGITENLARILPSGVDAILDSQSWAVPDVFSWIMQDGRVAQNEMWQTFNCGIGMIAVVPAEHCDAALSLLSQHGETGYLIGEIVTGNGNVTINS